MACAAGQIDTIDYLLKHGANVHIRNNEGQIPLNLAAINFHRISAFSLFAKMTNLTNLGIASLPNHFGLDNNESLMTVLSKISKDKKQLFEAAKEGNKATINILDAIGVNLDSKTICGQNALDLSSENGKYDVVEFLLDNGVDCGCDIRLTVGNSNSCNKTSGFCYCEDSYSRRTCSPKCRTSQGYQNKGKLDTACVFPFTVQGNTYCTCTYDFNSMTLHQKPWCSTKTDENGKHVSGNWGVCDNNDCNIPKRG